MFLSLAAKKFAFILSMVCLLPALSQAQESAVQPKNYYSSDFVIDGIPRNISFYIPASYGKRENYPLVFALHNEGEDGKVIIKRYGDSFEKLADSAACIIVFADAVKGHWNTRMGATAATDTINDASFITIMIDYFIQQYKADANRVYIAGFYSGGQQAWRLACDMPKKITAIAPFITSVADAQKYCPLNTTPFFKAEKYTNPPGKKISYEVIREAFGFLLQQAKQ